MPGLTQFCQGLPDKKLYWNECWEINTFIFIRSDRINNCNKSQLVALLLLLYLCIYFYLFMYLFSCWAADVSVQKESAKTIQTKGNK